MTKYMREYDGETFTEEEVFTVVQALDTACAKIISEDKTGKEHFEDETYQKLQSLLKKVLE